MNNENHSLAFRFLIRVTIFHVLTYFIYGLLASAIFQYSVLFESPIIRDYYKQYGTVSNYIGPVIQILRGLIFGIVLLPFKKTIQESKIGWLYTWALFVGIGILGTPAAAPSSIEGFIYTKIPLWFHLIGFPEILLQTLTFSLIIHNSISQHKFIKNDMAIKLIKAFSIACFSFIGYTVVSIAFALLSKVKIEESGADIKILAQFISPLFITFIVALLQTSKLLTTHLALYFLSVVSIISYQTFVLGSGNWIYAVTAPILPAIISYIFLKNRKA